MRIAGLAPICVALLAAACASNSGGTGSGSNGGSNGTGPNNGSGTEGVAGPGQKATPNTVNSYGVPYPTQNIGTSARKGTTPGSVIQNFAFYSYEPGADLAQAPATVSLSKFYDPQGKNGTKIIHLTASARWCGPCNAETAEMVRLKSSLEAKGVVFFQALTEGFTQGIGATTKDLQEWIRSKQINFVTGLDPSVRNLGEFFNAAAVPWNADVDARTMEILNAYTGAPQDVEASIMQWVNWVNANPPSYESAPAQ